MSWCLLLCDTCQCCPLPEHPDCASTLTFSSVDRDHRGEDIPAPDPQEGTQQLCGGWRAGCREALLARGAQGAVHVEWDHHQWHPRQVSILDSNGWVSKELLTLFYWFSAATGSRKKLKERGPEVSVSEVVNHLEISSSLLPSYFSVRRAAFAWWVSRLSC